MLSETEFHWQLRRLRDQYRRDNAWVESWAHWSDDEKMDWFIDCAFQLYESTASNRLQLTVLGGTAIRMDETLIQNFGITGVSGIQDAKTKQIVFAEMITRLQRSVQLGTDIESEPIRKGCILSERGWTPILNDALILGAISAGQDFYLGLTSSERHAWQKLHDDKIKKATVQRANFDDSEVRAAWREFLNTRRRMFFDRFTPRVFTREILGLSFFGYVPEYSWHQLRFRPGPHGVHPDFATYLRKLRGVGFGNPCDKKQVLAEVSTFLFGDEDAITGRRHLARR